MNVFQAHERYWWQPLYYNDLRVIENINMPEFMPFLELSNKVTVSREFREKTNKYYLDRFGRRAHFLMMNDSIICHPENIKRLKNSIK